MSTITINVQAMDVHTCPRCRWEVPEGMVCRCPMRTKGPAIEPVLTRIVNGRVVTE